MQTLGANHSEKRDSEGAYVRLVAITQVTRCDLSLELDRGTDSDLHRRSRFDRVLLHVGKCHYDRAARELTFSVRGSCAEGSTNVVLRG